MEQTGNMGPIIVRLFEAMNDFGISDDNSERRRIIKQITGVSKQNLVHWFNGTTTTPGVDHIVKLSEHFNIDLNWLITGESRNSASVNSKYTGDTMTENKEEPQSPGPQKSNSVVIDRLCEGIRQSGITDVKESLIKTANDMYGVAHQTVLGWLSKESEPTLVEAASLCEFYGVAQRYVSLGVGPVLALDYVSALEHNKKGTTEVLHLKDVALLGNV